MIFVLWSHVPGITFDHSCLSLIMHPILSRIRQKRILCFSVLPHQLVFALTLSIRTYRKRQTIAAQSLRMADYPRILFFYSLIDPSSLLNIINRIWNHCSLNFIFSMKKLLINIVSEMWQIIKFVYVAQLIRSQRINNLSDWTNQRPWKDSSHLGRFGYFCRIFQGVITE